LDRDEIRKYILTEEKFDNIGARGQRRLKKIFVTVCCSACCDRVINSRRQQKFWNWTHIMSELYKSFWFF